MGEILFCRFRQVPTFGRDTIRKFGGSVSAMKKLAGRDFEDILQVSAFPSILPDLASETQFLSLKCWIPVLEDILPNREHNKALLDLAFDLATWHAYAKLRLHTTHTIKSFRTQTKELGCQLRHYANKVCPEYATKPLPGEAAASHRRKATKAKKAALTPQPPKAPDAKSNARKNPGFTPFNLETYKIHAIGDYADHIEQFGPTDCFSTQQVCSTCPRSSFSSPCITE